ncbi:carbohydrate kinase [Sphingomonas sp.]|uniref:FGGY-family carbohydrate kinase n=1 Tax=Sphingomonas sp. TaxID=28214 RepID=UPI0025E0EF1E|nr:carbohydrate kinase [Sphingomonas sp.]
MTGELVVVLDIGKTMSKLTLWTKEGELLARETRVNERIDAGAYAALDVAGIEAWLALVLSDFGRRGSIGSIIPVGHGAAAAIIRGGALALPPMDYEQAIPAEDRELYAGQRSRFSETGSPFLADGLNLGAQLHFIERLKPEVLGPGALILPWAQYWAWRLSGVAASEVTSLGCHTDLWNPRAGKPSQLAWSRGWASLMPRLRKAGDVLGPLSPEWVERTGLSGATSVHCGLHDSNAALLAARGFDEIAGRDATIMSTGTWFVAMRTPGAGCFVDPVLLPAARDTLINVDVSGRMIPSARFMGGREIELLTGRDTRRIDIKADQADIVAATRSVLEQGARVLPTFAPGFGPFAAHCGRWIDKPTDQASLRAAVSLYAALVADVSLGLIGAGGCLLVEGRFAEAEVFVRALAALRPNDKVYRANAHNDVSFGALRLLQPGLRPSGGLELIQPLALPIENYRERWHDDVAGALEAVS